MPQAVQYFLIPILLRSLLAFFGDCEANRDLEHGILGDQAKDLDSSHHPGELRKSLDFPGNGTGVRKDHSVGARMDLDSWCG